MAISVQNKKRHDIRRRHGARVMRRPTLDGLTPTARSNYVRWFDPTVGRWLTEDPTAADTNLYRYCENVADGWDGCEWTCHSYGRRAARQRRQARPSGRPRLH